MLSRLFAVEMKMKIYGLEKLSMVDFDGHLCCTVFTGGCNFRCPYCQNADLVKARNIKEIPLAEFFSFLEKRKGVLDSVCISGGEPTLQADLALFIERIKALGYKVKLDTNGTNPALLRELMGSGLLDYVAMDIKSSKKSYSAVTKADSALLKKVEESVELLKKGKVDYELRTTLARELISKQDIEEMADWLAGADKLYLQCFKDQGTNLESGLHKVEKSEAEEYKAILEKKIKRVELRGY